MSNLNHLCDDCRTEAHKWLDYRKPLVSGVTISTSGNPKHAVPTHTRTADIVRSQLEMIQENCVKKHDYVG